MLSYQGDSCSFLRLQATVAEMITNLAFLSLSYLFLNKIMISLLKFINTETNIRKVPILLMAMVAGLTTSLILVIITQAAKIASSNANIEIPLFLLYLLIVMVFFYTRQFVLSSAVIAIENAIANVRIRIVEKIRCSNLEFMEKKGKVDIYTNLTQNINLISHSALILVGTVQASLVLVFCFFYIAWLSPLGFVLILLSLLLAIKIYFFYIRNISEELRITTAKETEFFDTLDQFLKGFKEIKINQQKNNDLFAHIETISAETKRIKQQVGLNFVDKIMFSNTFTNLMLGILVFILPIFTLAHAEVIIHLTAALLFILGAIGTVITGTPTLAQADFAVENLKRLEAELDVINQKNVSTIESENVFVDFKTIELDKLRFQYQDKKGEVLFQVGPIDLTIQQGEILFVVGGNGSGKSTLLKLLTGLYYPSAGHLAVDEQIIDQYNYQAYRELFSIIFTDFHLFDRLYGLPTVDEQQLKALLRLMELDRKTQYFDNHFTRLDLSTGQKKRLAFITAVLDNKPIYIFDEWAADQDPHFKKYFYEEIIFDLRNEGKTVIAVTHDDRYFDLADRVIKMDYGKMSNG